MSPVPSMRADSPRILSSLSPAREELTNDLKVLNDTIDGWSRLVTESMAARADGSLDKEKFRERLVEHLRDEMHEQIAYLQNRLEETS